MDRSVVQNYLGSLDCEKPMHVHFRQCMDDAFLYKWDRETRLAVMMGIEDAYKGQTSVVCPRTSADN